DLLAEEPADRGFFGTREGEHSPVPSVGQMSLAQIADAARQTVRHPSRRNGSRGARLVDCVEHAHLHPQLAARRHDRQQRGDPKVAGTFPGKVPATFPRQQRSHVSVCVTMLPLLRTSALSTRRSPSKRSFRTCCPPTQAGFREPCTWCTTLWPSGATS